MKKLLLSLFFIPFIGVAQTRLVTGTKIPLTFSSSRIDTATTAIDTIKVRMQLDDGPGIAILINGYLVRKFISYGHKHPWGNIWSKERFMDETWDTIDPIRIWDYRERNWEYGKDSIPRHHFIVPGNFKGL